MKINLLLLAWSQYNPPTPVVYTPGYIVWTSYRTYTMIY